jgi:hypothetical protein
MSDGAQASPESQAWCGRPARTLTPRDWTSERSMKLLINTS